MLPRKMDEDNLLSGRRVHEGEVIGQVGNFSKKEGGTSYHLHFDVQVPTRDGWVFVNPYMTLVAAYERLIGGRGEEISPSRSWSPPPTRHRPVPPAPASMRDRAGAGEAAPRRARQQEAQGDSRHAKHHKRKKNPRRPPVTLPDRP